ncbi:hypothetical protein THARTR1_09792 [Trichoderma harzianum]|uniref:Uncharacterized protein n=1 Tax=Trichoderma harzianum TaxID=5544 RepID=A0A2K0TVB8_TRIHA|nr:hypothetical protein THARTR1_09792 [Trichoderma harzianum]
MSDRPLHRGGRGGDRGNYRGRGGAAGGGRGGASAQGERPKKENILDLAKYMDKEIVVKFNGGREGTQWSKGRRKRVGWTG